MNSAPEGKANARTRPRSYLVAIAVAIVVIAAITSSIYLILLAPPGGGGGPGPGIQLTVVNGSSMTWTVYSGTHNSSVPFMFYIWNVTSVNGAVVIVNETSEVVGSGIPASRTMAVTKDDFKTGPAGVPGNGLSVIGTTSLATPFGQRTARSTPISHRTSYTPRM